MQLAEERGGRRWAACWACEGLHAIIVWGRPDASDLERLTACLEAAAFRPHASLVDLRRLEAVDVRTLDQVPSQLAPRQERLKRGIRRQAVLGWSRVGARLIDAFCSAHDPGFPVLSCEEPAEALDWLGFGLGVLDELEGAYQRATSATPLLSAIRAELERAPGLELTALARRLGLSRRTLQRRLRELGTSFQAETTETRLRFAKTLMLDTNYSLKRIALESGCASLQHFSSFFQEHVGTAPSVWREHQKV